MDRILNHRAGPIIYYAFKAGVKVDEIADVYKTTPYVIRLILRRYLEKVLKCGVYSYDRGPA